VKFTELHLFGIDEVAEFSADLSGSLSDDETLIVTILFFVVNFICFPFPVIFIRCCYGLVIWI
jgi:hypothetical protein